MSLCQSCGKNDAIFHVTLNLQIFGPTTTRIKVIQFILCDSCEVGMQQIFCKDDQLKLRIATRLSDAPEYKSEVPVAWKHRNRGYNSIEQG